MSLSEEKLRAVYAQLKKGVAPQKETVRSFLGWFKADRRGVRVIYDIHSRLRHYGIVTKPDFEYAYIDAPIEFQEAPSDKDTAAFTVADVDPTDRIGRLKAANKPPLRVGPNDTLQHAVTLMLANDYSQLPVLTSSRNVKGIVSWRSIGSRLALKRNCAIVKDCMEPAHEVSVDDSLLSALATIAIYDYVIVRGADSGVCGIVTATDFNEQFRNLAEPFLLVGEIERGIRRMLHGKFSAKELQDAKSYGGSERPIAAISDLGLGEYVKLLEDETRWKKLNVAIDRSEFLSRLNKVREVRNDVVHFDPDGLAESDLQLLRDFAQFMKKLRDVAACGG